MKHGVTERDTGISELIKHFDQYEDAYKLDPTCIPHKEQLILAEEIQKCHDSFEYASRNYFWIINKKRIDQLLVLNEGQELIYEKIKQLRAKNLPQKLMIIKARQLGALDPDTRILTDDLRWKSLGSASVGDQLVSVDEKPHKGGNGRNMRRGAIDAAWTVKKKAFRVVMENGQSLVCSEDHPWLVKARGSVWTKWMTTGRLKPGDVIRRITEPWSDGDYEDGWFGGLLDGEGSCRKKDCGGMEIGPSQRFGNVYDRAQQYLSERGYTFHVEVDRRKSGEKSKLGNSPVAKLLVNRMDQVFRLVGQTRPIRFIDKPWWEGKGLPGKGHWSPWVKILAVEPVGTRELVDIQTSTGTFIAEGFITHNCSTLIEGLIAWKSMFFPSTNAMVVSNVGAHATYLFGLMTHILDQLPWWMRPMTSSRQEEDGLVFKNPDQAQRRNNPGLNSQVLVQAANQISGVGQGYRLNAIHFSEYCDVDDSRAKEIIDGDLVNALAENVDSFAILESTAKGAGRYSEDLWRANVDLAEQAEWYPLFLPWFFEKTRFVAPEDGWVPHEAEVGMRDRIASEWVQCDNCEDFRERAIKGIDLDGEICIDCGKGHYHEYILRDDQLYWMRNRRMNAERRGPDSIKELKQELCTTAEEAFQISGIEVFPQETQDFVNLCVRPALYLGNLDNKGRFHAPMKVKDTNGAEKTICFQDWCKEDHTWDDRPLKIWELPEDGAKYTVGADVAEGLGGKADYSVAWINKVGNVRSADVHVGTYRSNIIDPAHFAAPLVYLGRWYNEAMLSIEYNIYQTAGDLVRIFYQYPNLFRWKHYDSVRGLDSNKWHWLTQQNSKPQLWQTAVRRLRERTWIVKDSEFAFEMKRFQKEEYDSKRASAETNFHDDVVMAAMIALYTSHDLDWEDNVAEAEVANPGVVQSMDWICTCSRPVCKHEWPSQNPDREPGCPKCGCPMIRARKNIKEGLTAKLNWEELGMDPKDVDIPPELVAHY